MLEAVQNNWVAVSACFCVLIGSILLTQKWRQRKRKSPPGLPSIPFLGSLPWLPRKPDHLHFTKLAKKYGNIFTIDFGRQHAVVLNDHSSIHEALVKQAVIFAGRPSYSTMKSINPKGKGFANAQYDEAFYQKKQKAIAVFRQLGFGRNGMESRILSEIAQLLEVVADKNGDPFDPGELFFMALANTMCSVLFSKRFDYDGPRFVAAVHAAKTMFRDFGQLMVVEFLPVVGYLPWARRTKQSLIENFRLATEFIKDEIEEREKTRHPDDNESDFIGAYQHAMADAVDREDLQVMVLDSFTAGIDTTSITLRWALVYMINNPDVQARCRGEIDDVVGQGRPPSMSDRSSLRYVDATILEILRMSSIAGITVPHSILADTTLQGFFLEKGTVVYLNHWAVNRDPDVWPDPERFNPERFLDDQGQITGRGRLITFGNGLRACPGEPLARQELFLYLTSILQRFQVLPPPGHDRVSEEAVHGKLRFPHPQDIVLRPR